MIQSIIAVAVVLGGLIFFHELGHFIVARLFGVGVTTFSLGFGPRLFGVRHNHTDYKVSAIPLGGYVHMVGEQPGQELPEGFSRKDSFNARPAWQRMLIVAAGPFFNFFLAILIYWGIFWSQGQLVLVPEVGRILADSPAMEAGLREGDVIRSVDGSAIDNWEDLLQVVAQAEGRELALTIERDGQTRTVTLTPRLLTRTNIFGEESRVPMIGVAASGKTRAVPLGGGSAFTAAVEQTWNVLALTVEGVIKMIERVIPVETIGGPIMIAQMVSQQAEEGLVNVLALAALISINLGFLNLLPIPVLDGGHILFFAIETVTGKPLSERWQAITIRIGLALLLGLMLLAIYNDVTRIFKDAS